MDFSWFSENWCVPTSKLIVYIFECVELLYLLKKKKQYLFLVKISTFCFSCGNVFFFSTQISIQFIFVDVIFINIYVYILFNIFGITFFKFKTVVNEKCIINNIILLIIVIFCRYSSNVTPLRQYSIMHNLVPASVYMLQLRPEIYKNI